jgi:hypothetical protein
MVKAKRKEIKAGEIRKAPGFRASQNFEKTEIPMWQDYQLYAPATFTDPVDEPTAGSFKSLKTSNDPIGNRTHVLPPCSAVPQSTAPPREGWLS